MALLCMAGQVSKVGSISQLVVAAIRVASNLVRTDTSRTFSISITVVLIWVIQSSVLYTGPTGYDPQVAI